MNWLRVNRKYPCKICEHRDWCGYSSDGNYVICMRIHSGQQTRNGGWLHKLSDPVPFIPYHRRPQLPDKPPDLDRMYSDWARETDYHFLDGFAMTLGVDSDALQAVGCAWSGQAWAFPMWSATKELIGIRLRGSDGAKWAVAGSKQGLFIPDRYPYCINDSTMYLTEGPTDLAAAMTLGLHAIARPSCVGQEDMITAYLSAHRVRRIVIITDNDAPGLTGAGKLQHRLGMRSCIWTPPAKDLRDYVVLGGTANLIESSIRDLIWKAA